MAKLKDYRHGTYKKWTIGPITLNGARITGCSGGTCTCKFFPVGSSVAALTVAGSYTAQDLDADGTDEDYFVFEIEDTETALEEGSLYTYEHELNISSKKRTQDDDEDWFGCIRCLTKKS
jgi:hypothetical protein